MTSLAGEFQTDLPLPEAIVACTEAIEGLGWRMEEVEPNRIVSYADTGSQHPPKIEMALEDSEQGTNVRITGSDTGASPLQKNELIAELDRVRDAINASVEGATAGAAEGQDIEGSTPTTRVCPRCGDPGGESDYCTTCGLHLVGQPELPTREEWEVKRAERSSSVPPSAATQPGWTTGSAGRATRSAAKRNPAILAAVGVMILGIVGAGFWHLTGHDVPLVHESFPFVGESTNLTSSELEASFRPLAIQYAQSATQQANNATAGVAPPAGVSNFVASCDSSPLSSVVGPDGKSVPFECFLKNSTTGAGTHTYEGQWAIFDVSGKCWKAALYSIASDWGRPSYTNLQVSRSDEASSNDQISGCVG